MIFLTVGTTRYPFERLIGAVDKALIELKFKEELIAQVGPNKYKFLYPRVRKFSEVPFKKVVFYLSHSSVTIAHGGMGTALLALNYCKNKPILVPRMGKLGEHVDDHQVYFVEHLFERKLVFGVLPEENLVKRLKFFLTHPERKVLIRRTKRKELIDSLCLYTDQLSFSKKL